MFRSCNIIECKCNSCLLTRISLSENFNFIFYINKIIKSNYLVVSYIFTHYISCSKHNLDFILSQILYTPIIVLSSSLSFHLSPGASTVHTRWFAYEETYPLLNVTIGILKFNSCYKRKWLFINVRLKLRILMCSMMLPPPFFFFSSSFSHDVRRQDFIDKVLNFLLQQQYQCAIFSFLNYIQLTCCRSGC